MVFLIGGGFDWKNMNRAVDREMANSHYNLYKPSRRRDGLPVF